MNILQDTIIEANPAAGANARRSRRLERMQSDMDALGERTLAQDIIAGLNDAKRYMDGDARAVVAVHRASDAQRAARLAELEAENEDLRARLDAILLSDIKEGEDTEDAGLRSYWDEGVA